MRLAERALCEPKNLDILWSIGLCILIASVPDRNGVRGMTFIRELDGVALERAARPSHAPPSE